jgi:Ni/Co efflux regulator RcnB
MGTPQRPARYRTDKKGKPMKRLRIATTALTLLVTPLSAAFAKDHGDRHDDRGNAMTMQRHDNDRHDDYRGGDDRHDNGRHRGWYKGGRIERNDWNRGERINDYGYYRLSRPPVGYEWRRVDDNYVLAAVAGGLIASVILANQ